MRPGTIVKECGRGDVKLTVTIGGCVWICLLQNLLHAPDSEYSLFSLRTIDTKGILTTIGNG